MAMFWLWCMVNGVAACGAVRAFAGFATVVMLIFGGWVPQDLGSSARPPSKVERGRRGRLLRRLIAELLCARPGCSGRLANRNELWGWLA